MPAKKRQTIGKINRERELREKRALKQERKDRKKLAAAAAAAIEAERGEAHYAVLIKPGEEIWTGDGRHLRVLDVVQVEANITVETNTRHPAAARLLSSPPLRNAEPIRCASRSFSVTS